MNISAEQLQCLLNLSKKDKKSVKDCKKILWVVSRKDKGQEVFTTPSNKEIGWEVMGSYPIEKVSSYLKIDLEKRLKTFRLIF